MFQVFWRSIKDTFDELFTLILTNLVWCVMSLPLLVLAVYAGVQNAPLPAAIMGMLAVLPAGPATAGLYTIAQRTNEGRTSNLGHFFAGMRENAKFAWQIYGIWMLGMIVILFNFFFYAQMGSTLGAFLQVIFIYLFFIWLALLIYVGPLMLLQTEKRLGLLARNAGLMVLGRPIFTLVTLVLMVAISILAMLPGLVVIPGLILFAFLAVWSFRAANKVVDDAEERRRLEAEKAAEKASGVRYSKEEGRGGQIRPRK